MRFKNKNKKEKETKTIKNSQSRTQASFQDSEYMTYPTSLPTFSKQKPRH